LEEKQPIINLQNFIGGFSKIVKNKEPIKKNLSSIQSLLHTHQSALEVSKLQKENHQKNSPQDTKGKSTFKLT
jgi:hypothetical protein